MLVYNLKTKGKLIELNLNEVILVGEEFDKQNSNLSYKSFKTTDETIDYLKQLNPIGKNIFMKGSRGMKLETIAEVIS